MAPRNVVLIGFMGAGKSAVGRALADQLGFQLYDTDVMVETSAGQAITQIWDDEGEEGFRAREHDAVLQACAGSGRVIASGGGAVLDFRNYGVLKGAGTVVYLRAPADVLRARVGIALDRPLLQEPGAFDRLLAERTPAYESAADLIVDTDEHTPDEVAGDIAGRLT
jgi:shikimate kinase